MLLKFLAYDSDAGIFEPDFINKGGYAVGKINDKTLMSTKIMRCTGVSDRKGTMIYEDYIVSAYDKKWKVVFSQGGFCLYRPGRWLAIGTVYCEVIGNTHQHPKLMFQK